MAGRRPYDIRCAAQLAIGQQPLAAVNGSSLMNRVKATLHDTGVPFTNGNLSNSREINSKADTRSDRSILGGSCS